VAAPAAFNPLDSLGAEAATPVIFSTQSSAALNKQSSAEEPAASLYISSLSDSTAEVVDLTSLGSLALVNPFVGLGLGDDATTPSLVEGYRHSAGALTFNRFAAIDDLYADSLLDSTDELCNDLADAVYEDGQVDAETDEFAEMFEALEV
jgi:hypothetical protein